MASKGGAHLRAMALEELGGAFDVAEEEADGPFRHGGHEVIMAQQRNSSTLAVGARPLF